MFLLRPRACGTALLLALAGTTGCASRSPATSGTAAPPPRAAPAAPAPVLPQPILPARDAMLRGWMPLDATGVPAFLKAHPGYDGRGVLIAILDSGLDPGIPGLTATPAGERKILDLRDFSGEGAVALARVTPEGDHVAVGSTRLAGVSRLRALAVGQEIWAGGLAELPLGELPAADLNGDGDDADTLAVVVVRATDGWVLFADTDGDGSLANERAVHDYLHARETFAWQSGGRPATHTLAANFREERGEPRLDLYFDTSAHGSHVAGIAAGNDIQGVTGFDGVAPGAWLLGLKIADNAQGGISTTGSMLAAMDYALRFARTRRLPLVMNLSFGVGNEAEGRARIDALVDSVLAAHPDVVMTISAGNDGPGLTTMGFPASAERAITVGATFPSVFLGPAGSGPDPVAYFSSRGGELAKPDLVTPGVAYSTVPRWDTGDERKGGTSMAAPHAAGLAALLVSGLVQENRPVVARQVRQALMITARPARTGTYLDDGTGVPDVAAAWRWLGLNRTVPEVRVRAAGNGVTAAWRVFRGAAPADSAQGFVLSLPADAPESPVTLRSGAPWLRAPARVTLRPGDTPVSVSYDRAALGRPGVYTGVVTGWGQDSLAGPLFRLVNTIIVPEPGPTFQAEPGRIPPGGEARVFFDAEAGRPFAVGFTTREPGEQLLAYLHEPGGQPYREQNGIGAGYGEQAGLYVVDGRDVLTGLYEAVAVAPPLDGASAAIIVQQSPVRIAARRAPAGVVVGLDNLDDTEVATEPFVVLVGAERTARIIGQGSEIPRLRFSLPEWAVHATVDVSLDPTLWPRFTDLGVTLFDADGRQLGKSPLNYAFGRLHVDLDREGGRPGEAELALFPGLAEPGSTERWTAAVSLRLYTDSAHVVRLPGQAVTVPPGREASVTVPLAEPPYPLGDGFFPLGIVVVPEGDRTWTREVPLPAPIPALNP